MPSVLIRSTPFWQLWQLLAPNPAEFGKGLETEIKRLGVLGLQFAAVVAIVLPGTSFLFSAWLWYFEADRALSRLLLDNLENFGILLVGVSALSLSRTSIGENHPNLVAIWSTVLAEAIATTANLVRLNPATYPPFVISLLVLAAVVPIRPVVVVLVGLIMIGMNYILFWLLVGSGGALKALLSSFPLGFFLTITLVCTGLTTVIYHLRIKNFRNLEALRLSQERLQRELAVAGLIQMHSLPRENPVVPGLAVAGACLSATEVGGDYYDYLRCGQARLGVLVGDVSGKGTSAALYMSKLQGIVRALEHLHQHPAQLLTAVNDLIYGTIERTSFITLTYGIFDLRERRLTVSRAGHHATLHFDGHDPHFLVPQGLGLGLAPHEIFHREIREVQVSLKPGEILVFYTDGLVEARNLAGEEYGEDRLVRLVAAYRELEARALNQKIMDDVRRFIGYATQHDDMTVIVAKVE